MTTSRPASYGQLAGFFLPLALQSTSQSLSYPLVAMVAARGAGGPLDIAGVAQAYAALTMFWIMSSGLITAGMVYIKSREGYARFARINGLAILCMAVLYGLLMIPVLSHYLFSSILGLPPDIERPARIAFIASLPSLVVFYLRNPYQVILASHHATHKAFLATAGRILFTLILALLFCRWGLVGAFWAVTCQTLATTVEWGMLCWFARQFIARLPSLAQPPPRYSEIIRFVLTLSVGGLFLALSGFIVGGFIAHAPMPGRMLPVYYLVFGVVAMLAFGITGLQPLMIAFYGKSLETNRRLLSFTLVASVIMGCIPLIFLFPDLLIGYYVKLQKLDPGDIGLVRASTLAFLACPLAVGLRAYSEGKAASMKKSAIILAGQGVYLAIVAIVGVVALKGNVPGNLIGPLVLTSANMIAAFVVLLFVRSHIRGLRGPVPQAPGALGVGP